MQNLIPRVCALVFAAAMAAGCAATPNNRPGEPMKVPHRFMVTYREDAPYSRDTLRMSVEQVWATLPAVYQELGLPGTPASNTQERVFITPHVRIRGQLFTGNRNSSFLDCGVSTGGAPRADTHAVTFMMMTRLRVVSEGITVVESMLDGTAREHVSSNTAAECAGTGRLEKHVVALIRQKARPGGG